MNWGLDNKAKTHKVKGRKNLTVMLISDPTKTGITLRIPKWVRFPLMILPVILILGALYTYSYIVELESQLVAAKADTQSERYVSLTKDNTIDQLQVTNEKRYRQLEGLAALTVELKTTLSELETYKEVIDLKLGTTEKTTDTQPTKRLSGDSETLSLKDASTVINDLNLTSFALEESFAVKSQAEQDDFSAEIDRLLEEVAASIDETESEIGAYSDRDEQVDEILPYWEAYPSVYPVENTYVTSAYGYRRNPFGYGYELHKGVDFKARYQDVMATGAGTVTYSGYNNGYGYMVIIDHGYGILTKYAHNSKLLVEEGDTVERYDVIATSGNSGRSSGPHLHYEVIVDGENQDPMTFIDQGE